MGKRRGWATIGEVVRRIRELWLIFAEGAKVLTPTLFGTETGRSCQNN